MGGRFVKDERGFTLPELMVTIMIMITVLFALYSIFDMSMRVFSFGNDKVEAAENARLGLEKMTREIRAAYPADKASGKDHLFWSQGTPSTAALPTGSQITFGNELNGNRKIYTSAVNVLDPNEEITYVLSSAGPPHVLQRIANDASGSYTTSPVVEFVKSNGLKFTYLKRDGTLATSQADIAIVRIELTIDVQGRTQKLTTDVALSNRGN